MLALICNCTIVSQHVQVLDLMHWQSFRCFTHMQLFSMSSLYNVITTGLLNLLTGCDTLIVLLQYSDIWCTWSCSHIQGHFGCEPLKKFQLSQLSSYFILSFIMKRDIQTVGTILLPILSLRNLLSVS